MDFVKLVTTILPPMTAMQTWRVLVAIGLMLAGFHVFWAAGMIPGLTGFAQTNQVAEIKRTVEETQKKTDASIASIKDTQSIILVRLIASSIEDARARQCDALKTGNPQGAQGWRARLDSALYEYRVSSGRDYALRGCDEY